MSRMRIIVFAIIGAMFMAGLYACAETSSIAKAHPVEVKTLSEAVCSACHDDDRSALDHNNEWIKKHRFYAQRRKQVCGLCHEDAFCSGCHENKSSGLLPSDKHKDEPENFMPHRGDYLTQHMIDGRIDPAPCMKCHGRQNNAICRSCHK